MIAPAPRHDRSPLQSLDAAFGALRRHKWRAIGVAALVMGLVVAGLVVVPRAYESEAKLFVKVGRESVALDPTATTGQVISVYESRENEINSVIDVLESRAVVDRAVEKLGVETVLGRTSSDEKLDHEKAVRTLQRVVRVVHSKKSSVIGLVARSDSPERAQKIVKAVLEAFREVHLRVNQTAGSFEFFRQQADVLKQKLDESTAKLRDLKNDVGLISVESQRKLLNERTVAVSADKSRADADLASAEASIAALRKSIDRLPQRMETQRVSGSPNSAADRTRQQLGDLRARESLLLAKYTAEHWQVVAVREQMTAAERYLKQIEPDSTQSTSAAHPARQQLEIQLLTDSARADAYRARSTALAAQLVQLRKQLRDLNSTEGEVTRLDQQVASLQKSHLAYVEKREQARIGQELFKERISNVNVVQPATFVSKPVSPKKRLVLGLGLFVAIVSGLGASIGVEWARFLRNRPVEAHAVASTSEAVIRRDHVTEPV